MNAALGVALAALLLHLAAFWRPAARTLAWGALALTVAALALRMPGVGATPVGLAAALAMSWVGGRRGDRRLHMAAALCCLPAVLFAPAVAPAAWLAYVGGALSHLLFAVCLAAGVDYALDAGPGGMFPLAAAAAAAPIGAAVASPLSDGAAVPLALEPISWLQRGGLMIGPGETAQWAVSVWNALPTIGLVCVLLAWGLRSRRATRVLVGLWAGLALAAVAAHVPTLLAWTAETAQTAVIATRGGLTLPLHTSGLAPGVDASAAVLLFARIVLVGGLIGVFGAFDGGDLTASDDTPMVATGAAADSASAALPVGGFAIVFALLAVWAWAAPGFVGPNWLFDPAAMAAVAVLVASFALQASATAPVKDTVNALRVVAAAMLVGGGDLGWRVASTLLAS